MSNQWGIENISRTLHAVESGHKSEYTGKFLLSCENRWKLESMEMLTKQAVVEFLSGEAVHNFVCQSLIHNADNKRIILDPFKKRW